MKLHKSENIRELLRNSVAMKQITKDKGCNPRKVKLYLENLLEKGDVFLKDEKCNHFDPRYGCLGHDGEKNE